MNEVNKQTAMDSLIREGIPSYLDAVFALSRFKRRVTDVAVEVLKARLPELASAIGMQGLQPDSVWPYYNPDGMKNAWDGNWAWLTARIWVPEPWNGACHLGLSFDRVENGGSRTYATFMNGEGSAALFAKLRAAYRHHDSYYEDADSRECGFSWDLKDPLTLRAELQKIMDHVINVWTQLGGWNHLARRDQ